MQPDKERVKAFYDQNYYSDIEGSGHPTKHHIRLAERLGINADERLLDVACGTGEWLKAVCVNGTKVSGIDLSERAVDFCRRDNPHGDFHCQSCEQLPFENDFFDWVSCLGSLEHFPDKSASMTEMVRVLRPGGSLVMSVPNSDFIGYKLGLYAGTNQAGVIETPMPISFWQALGEGAGMKLTRKWRDLHFVNLDWIRQNGMVKAVPRGLAALTIAALPLSLQYQVYFHFVKS
ncbi:MAG: class I SAM-dependent methyltransferase [Pseudomonadota bacterium]